jgi:hypothetical protein
MECKFGRNTNEKTGTYSKKYEAVLPQRTRAEEMRGILKDEMDMRVSLAPKTFYVAFLRSAKYGCCSACSADTRLAGSYCSIF